MSSEFTFGDNFWQVEFFFYKKIFLRIWLTVTSQSIRSLRQWHCHDSHATSWLEQTKGIRLFIHTQQVDWSRQGESDWFNQTRYPSFVVFCPMQCNPCVFVEWRPWNGSMTNTAWLGSIVCAQMLQLVKFGIVWICGGTGADREHSSYSECGRDRRSWRFLLHRLWKRSQRWIFQFHRLWKRSQKVNIPVTQIVEEIADREYSNYTDSGRDHGGECSSSTECGRDRRGEQILEWVMEYSESLLWGNQSVFLDELVWNKPVDKILCRMSDVLVKSTDRCTCTLCFPVSLSCSKLLLISHEHWRSHISSAISCLKSFCTFVHIIHVVVLNLRCRRSLSQRKRKFAQYLSL